jgi:hypothetical protein
LILLTISGKGRRRFGGITRLPYFYGQLTPTEAFPPGHAFELPPQGLIKVDGTFA